MIKVFISYKCKLILHLLQTAACLKGSFYSGTVSCRFSPFFYIIDY